MATHSLSSDALADIEHLHALVEMNEALTLGVIRQNELMEEAESLNTQLREEIAHRQLVERALRESEERFRGLFASAPMAVFACDRDGVIQQYNSKAAELWAREPICGAERYCGSVKLWLPDGQPLPHEQSPIVDVLRTGIAASNVELSMERPDASQVSVLANFAPLRNGTGEIIGAITSFTDLTERKKLEQRSHRSQRMESIGTLAGGIAHDLNNSLGPIVMALSLLRAKLRDSQSEELLTLVEASAQRGADMVRQILSFARGVEGRRAKVKVSILLGEIEKIVNETFLRHIQIRTRIPPDVWVAWGDSTQLHQVLLNLCLNARDAMPHGGVLVISAENRQIAETDEGLSQNSDAKAGPFVLFEVTDTGSGMPVPVMESIFDPFFTTKEFGKGSGLGLSTALTIVKSHGGFLQVRSEVGKGTTFQVFIPAETAIKPVEPPQEKEKMPEGHGELILVVDDELPMRLMTQRILEMFGYQVVVACDGSEAVAVYTQRRAEIAAVITDMTMPVMDGPDTIRALRRLNPNLRIIGTSGLASTNYASELAGLGVKHILSKPYLTVELLKMLKQILGESPPERREINS